MQLNVLSRQHARQVNELRKKAYETAHGMQVSDAGLFWNRSDDQSVVFGVWDRDQLISTMRMEVIDSPSLLEQKLECPWKFKIKLKLPVMLLSRAATAHGYRGGGLNAWLRSEALQLANLWEVPLAVGTLVKGSARERSMVQMGYVFLEHPTGWKQGAFSSSEPVWVAVLDLQKDLQQALNECARLSGTLGTVEYDRQTIAKRFVTVIR